MLGVRLLALRLFRSEFNSGVGATGVTVGRAGAMSEERRPSDGGGPGVGL